MADSFRFQKPTTAKPETISSNFKTKLRKNMAKYVIHKKGFFYTDEAFEEAEGAKGTIVATFDNLEDAKIEKERQDILSMQNLKGMNAVDFFFYSNNYDEIYQKLEAYYKSEFNLNIADKYYFELPDEISSSQSQYFLTIFDLSFHDIVEYTDDEVLNPDDFNLEEEELGEF